MVHWRILGFWNVIVKLAWSVYFPNYCILTFVIYSYSVLSIRKNIMRSSMASKSIQVSSHRIMRFGRYSRGPIDTVRDFVHWAHITTDSRVGGLRYTTSFPNMSNAKFLRKDFYPMWKKIQLINILVDNGVPRLFELFEEYKTSLAAFILEFHEVSWIGGCFVIVNNGPRSLRLKRMFGLRLYIVSVRTSSTRSIVNSLRGMYFKMGIHCQFLSSS